MAWEPDSLAGSEFASLMAPLFEDARRYLGRLAAGRPYGGWEALFADGVDVALSMPDDEQLELIDAHPRIGAPPGSVSALSFVEQGYDAESADAQAEAERARVATDLDRLNLAYEARFGFRYVIFVAGRSRSAIVLLMEAALDADRSTEQGRAIRDVVSIARDRAIKTGLMPQDATEEEPA